MEVHSDEAYYRLYGLYPAWGYYDHPPMVGWAVWLSSLFFNGNLGIRFITVLTHAATLTATWAASGIRTPDRRQTLMFFITAASCFMFQGYGFLTTPDSYLLFFTALFLYSFKKFLEKEDWSATLLLALSMTGMLYSKYHGVLVILFTIISCPGLLTKKKAWAAAAMTCALMLPHLLWQATNGFPSLRYHLADRSTGFSFPDMLGYLPTQLVVFNPVTLLIFTYIIIKHRAADQFEKTCRWLVVGFIAFFMLATLKGHVEPHWTVAASIPLILTVFRHVSGSDRLQRLTCRLTVPTIALTIVARILFLTQSCPSTWASTGNMTNTHPWQKRRGLTYR
ncbi:MAG TPA: glycosyltransferase family 39 protein [Candidatus Coprenecus stercoravium]|uniref:Glycosyltransferase family 39 protein n=1 Tax=Candidatus Coprenecus stercoravium TaxID=2840735 RepID=A0A9D2KAR9_9BACT|nr:glycosyltransferase family 39 protein [Candidatus Coprenecus stercoravium]